VLIIWARLLRQMGFEVTNIDHLILYITLSAGRTARMIEAAEELGKSASVSRACQILGVPRNRLYRARQPQRRLAPRPTPERALSLEEKAEVHQTLNCERFWNCSPREVYATLLDESIYLCHWRTMYRVLEEHDEVQERRNQLRHPTTPSRNC